MVGKEVRVITEEISGDGDDGLGGRWLLLVDIDEGQDGDKRHDRDDPADVLDAQGLDVPVKGILVESTHVTQIHADHATSDS